MPADKLEQVISEAMKMQTALSKDEWDEYANSVGASGEKVEGLGKEYKKLLKNVDFYKKRLSEIVKLKDKDGKYDDKTEKLIKKITSELGKLGGKSVEMKLMLEQIGDVGDELEETEKKTYGWIKAVEEGKREAKEFADGLGATATGATAAGIAFVYLATKINDLGGNILETQKKWAKYNASQAVAASTIPNFDGGKEGLDNLRTSLNLTSDETLEFTNLLKNGSASGVVSINKLVESARKLESTFGEDPTNRLREYVDLLKEIPSLDTDLKVTASLDDQAAAWFALAEKGKVEQVIEFQMAGLAGSETSGPPPGSKEEVESLRVQRRMETLQESMYKEFSSWIPSWSAYVVKATAVGLFIGGSTRIIAKEAGFMSHYLRQIRNYQRNEKFGGVLKNRGGREVADMGNSLFRSLFGNKATDKTNKLLVGIKTSLSKFFGRGVKVSGVGIKSGAETIGGAGGVARMFSAIAKAGARLAPRLTQVAGALGGVAAVGSVAGAAVGPFVALAKFGDVAGDALVNFGKKTENAAGFIRDTNFGKTLNAFSMALNPVGLALALFGKDTLSLSNQLEAAGRVVKGFGEHLKYSAKYWKDVGNSLYDFLFVSEKMIKARVLELKQLKLENKRRLQLQRTQRSAQTLQQIIGRLNAVIEGNITALSRLEQELGNTGIENISKVGGSMGDFNYILNRSRAGFKDEFSKMKVQFTDVRNSIEKDATLNSEMRRVALIKLHKAEMEATLKYVNGILDSVAQFDKIPEIIEKTLENQIRKAKLDLEIDIGADTGFFDTDSIRRNIEATASQLNSVIKDLTPEYDALKDLGMKLSASMGKSVEEVSRSFDDARKDLRDSVDKTGMKMLEEMESAIDFTSNASLKDSARTKFENNMKEAQKKFDELGEKISHLATDKTLDTLKEIPRLQQEKDVEYKKIADSVKEGSKIYNVEHDIEKLKKHIVKKYGVALDAKNFKGLTRGREAARKKDMEKLEQLQIQRDIEQQNLAGAREGAGAKAKELQSKQAEITAYAKRRAQETNNQIALEKINSNNMKEIYEYAKQQAEIDMGSREELSKQLNAYKSMIAAGTTIKNNESTQVALLTGREKLMQESINQTKGFIDNLNYMTDMLEKSPVIQSLERNIEYQQTINKLNFEYGKFSEAFGQGQQLIQEKLEKQVKMGEENIGLLNRMKSGGSENLNNIMKNAHATLQASTEMLGDIFGGDKLKEALGGSENIDNFKKELKGRADDINSEFDKFMSSWESGDKEGAKQIAQSIVNMKQAYFDRLAEASKAANKKGEKLNVEPLESSLENIITIIGGVTGGIDVETEKNRNAIAKFKLELAQLPDAIEDALSDINTTPIQKLKDASKESALAQIELSSLLMDYSRNGREAASAEKSLNEAYLEKQDNIKKAKEAEEKSFANITDRFNKGLITTQDYERDQIKHRKNLELIDKDAAQAQVDKMKSMYELVEQMVDAETKRLDLKDEELSIQKEILEISGASLGQILDVQMQEISVARERASILRDQLSSTSAAEIGSLQYKQLELEYSKAQAEVVKKSLGAQRDAYDKLLEKAFGAIRSERGARRQLLSKASVFGTGYVESKATGMVIAGGARSAEQVQAQRAAMGGVWGDLGRKPTKEKPEDKNIKASETMMTAGDAMKVGAEMFKASVGIIQNFFRNTPINPAVGLTPHRGAANEAVVNAMAGGAGATTSNEQDIRVNVVVSMEADKDGNITPAVKKIITEQIPKELRSNTKVSAELDRKYVKKNM